MAFSKVERFIELTGTPSPNGLIDLWGQMWFIDKGERLGQVFRLFTDRWFRAIRVGSHVGAVSHEPLEHAQQEIETVLADRCLSINIADYTSIDEPIIHVVSVELPSLVHNQYKKLQRELFCELQGETVEAFSAAAKTVKCLQMANGAVYVDEHKNWKEVHDAKIKALESIVEEANGSPLLVVYHFNSDLARLQKAFPKGRKLDKNPQTIDDWNAGKIPLLFVHPASSGHGLNLQYGGNIIVFFSLWWNLEHHQQIIERIGPARQKQARFNRPVFIYYLIAQNTIDELVFKRLQTKASVQELLLQALKKEKAYEL